MDLPPIFEVRGNGTYLWLRVAVAKLGEGGLAPFVHPVSPPPPPIYFSFSFPMICTILHGPPCTELLPTHPGIHL
jgi:hypothetical protein